MNDKLNIYDFDYLTMQSFVSGLGQPAYRADQIWQWLYSQMVTNFSAMTNLPNDFRSELDSTFEIDTWVPAA